MICRGIKDQLCLEMGDNDKCLAGGPDGFPFLIVTEIKGNKVFMEDAFLGLSPKPSDAVLSFSEYLLK